MDTLPRFKLLPWKGGLNTSLDASMIGPNQLTIADQIIMDTRDSKKTRDGIDFNWDSLSNGSTSVIAQHDFWFGATTKTQKKVGVFSDGTVYSYNPSSGVATQLTVNGKAWTGTLTSASLITFNNKCFIAVSGANNLMKYWDGTNNVEDAYGVYQYLSSISRASSGTTRTLVFNTTFPGSNGSIVIISGAGDSHYNGTFTITGISTTTVTNDTITYTGTSSLTEGTAADTGITAASSAPQASILREHLGRIFCNDKTTPDRLHYCQTGDHTLWLGYGDSGAIDIYVGDGDPVGLNGIFPTFQGQLVVGKQTKLYRMDGYSPETFVITKMSDSIGVASHNAIAAVDQDDVVWVSLKGVHSLVTTSEFGDLKSKYISRDIQKTFNEGFNKARMSNVWAAYNPEINSVAFTFSSINSSYNDSIYIYFILSDAWYTWSNIACQSLHTANDVDKYRWYIGSNTGRIAKAFNSTFYDINASGTHVNITYRLKTGNLSLDGDPYNMKVLRTFSLYHRPTGTYNISANIYLDNKNLNSENSLNFNGNGSTTLLGSTFILGSSILGANVVMAPYTFTIEGLCRTCQVEITHTQQNSATEIQGFGIDFDEIGPVAETILT